MKVWGEQGLNDTDDSILDEGDILEVDIWWSMRNDKLLREVTGLLPI
jgi:hypothetical protein